MTTVPMTTQERLPMPMSIVRPTAPGGAFTFNDVLRVLRQRMWLILLLFVVIVAATVAGTHWLIKNHPVFRSQSAVRVESPFPRKPMQFGEQMLQVDLMDRFVQDQMFLVKDKGLLDEALRDADIRGTRWFQSEQDKGKLLDDLFDGLDVRQSTDSSFFVVSFGTKHADDAPKIINTVLRLYLGKVRAQSLQQYSDELGEYRTRQSEMRRLLDQNRAAKENFLTSELAVPGLAAGVNVAGEMWRALAIQAGELEMQQLQLKAAFDNLKGLDPSQVQISPQMMMMIEQDPQVATLNNQLLALQQDRLAVLQKAGPNHQSVQAIDAQIAATQDLYEQVLTKKQEEARQYQVSSAETAWLNVLQAQLKMQERVDAARAEQRDADRKLAQYLALEDEKLQLEEAYKQITDYINQLELVVRDRETVRVFQVSQATAARERSSPRWIVNVPLGAIVGLLLGVGLAMLLEVVDTSIKTPRDVGRFVHVPVLGTIPDVDDDEVPIDKVELAMHAAPRSMVAEAFRSLRTNLLLSAPAERERTVLVTSAKPEEGKTAVACNLAIALAQNGRRVLLVDANFHRPALKEFFGKIPAEGLSSVLVGQATLEQVIVRSDLPNLDVLGGGPIPPNPAELLASSNMRDLVAQAADRYDQVIFDGPPVLLVSDGLVLAGLVDGVILVVRAKDTSRGVVMRARDFLERANMRIFGAVLNAARVTRGGYFREQIRSYYDYQPAESLRMSAPPVLPGKADDK